MRLIRAREVTCEGEQLRCIVSWYEYVWTVSSVTIEREILALVPDFFEKWGLAMLLTLNFVLDFKETRAHRTHQYRR